MRRLPRHKGVTQAYTKKTRRARERERRRKKVKKNTQRNKMTIRKTLMGCF